MTRREPQTVFPTRRFATPVVALLATLLVGLLTRQPVAAQDANILLPIDSAETLLRDAPFRIIATQGTRGNENRDRTLRVTMGFQDSTLIAAKWADAPVGGETFNNNPRFELAAYQIQKLFLDPKDYVVPPTILRSMPLDWYRANITRVQPTFDHTTSVLVVLQYWLFNVTGEDVWDEDRFAQDTAYARHFADLNILTYLIHHNDSNYGNLLISQDTSNPRIFDVDNGLAFDSEVSDRGTKWHKLLVDRLPKATVARLRTITQADLDPLLVLAQFQVSDNGSLQRVPATAPDDRNRGVTHRHDVIQFGLTAREIRSLQRRLRDLLKRVDDGKIEVF